MGLWCMEVLHKGNSEILSFFTSSTKMEANKFEEASVQPYLSMNFLHIRYILVKKTIAFCHAVQKWNWNELIFACYVGTNYKAVKRNIKNLY